MTDKNILADAGAAPGAPPAKTDPAEISMEPRGPGKPEDAGGGDDDGKSPRARREENRKKSHRDQGLERAFKLIGENNSALSEIKQTLGTLANTHKAASAASDVRPKREDFPTDDEHLDALADWRNRDKARKADTAQAAAAAVEAAKNGGAPPKDNKEPAERIAELTGVSVDLAQDFIEQQAEARQRHKDFDEVVNNPNVKLSAPVARLLVESEYGAEIQRLLCKDPDEATRLSAITSVRALSAEFDKLESKVKEGGAEEEPAPGKAPTSREPIDRPGTAKAHFRVPDDKLSDAEYFRRHFAEQRRKRVGAQ
jgi:hypothetical protein